MSRAKLFISYSHEDRAWLARITEHLAVLQRRDLVEIWADTRIGIGAEWEEEIEQALLTSRLALLLVSPSFMASAFIWEREIPHVVKHSTCGLDILPLIVRPCAWKLEPILEKLQARPADGKPLSVSSAPQIDLDLTALVYEIAGRLQAISSSVAASEAITANATQHHPALPELDDVGSIESGQASSKATAPALVSLPREWSGFYNGDRAIKLIIRQRSGDTFRGQLEYPNERTITKVEGKIEGSNSDKKAEDAQVTSDIEGVRLTFRELDYERKGTLPISFNGEYRGVLSEGKITGAWFAGSRRVGPFEMTAFQTRRRR